MNRRKMIRIAYACILVAILAAAALALAPRLGSHAPRPPQPDTVLMPMRIDSLIDPSPVRPATP